MNSSSVMENLSLEDNLTSGCGLAEDPGREMSYLLYYVAIMVIAIPSNSFSLYVSWQHIRQSNDLGVYLFNLALSDLTLSIGLGPWMDFIWRCSWVHGGYVCLLSVHLLFTNFYTSEALLCCISINRYLAVVHPLKFPALRRVGTAAGISGAVWALVICINAATISWEDWFRENGRAPLCFDLFPISDKAARVNMARFALGFVLPVLLVAFCTQRTFRAACSNQATEKQEKRRVSMLLVAVLLSLALCFGPVHVLILFRGLLGDCRSIPWLFYPYKVTVAISSLNCLADPLLYCFITRTGKANVTQVVFYLQGRRSARGPEAG